MSNQKKTLIVDGQLFQTAAWDRGMGRYVLQVLKELSGTYKESKKIILFNGQLDLDEDRLRIIRHYCPKFEQAIVNLPLANNTYTSARQYKKSLDTSISKLVPLGSQITYMLTSLFIFDYYAEYPSSADSKIVIFYDLIPLRHWKDLGGYFPPNLYMERFNRVYESDLVLCISKTTSEDVLSTFSISPEKVVNINGGYTENQLNTVKPKKIDVPKHYILFPTGNLPHKNNEFVFRAFKSVVRKRKDLHLIVTSRFDKKTIKKLTEICSENVIFSQNVKDEELQYLYKNAEMVLFASKYEGLGLPVLDAVYHNKPVVTSRISVFEEMSKDAFYYFDPNDPVSASSAILSVTKENFINKKSHYSSILKKYTWKNVGRKLIAGLASVQYHQTAGDKDREISNMHGKHIAIVSISPGIEGSIGRLAEKLYGHLRCVTSVSYFFDSCGLRHDQLDRPTYLDHLYDTQVYDLSRLTIEMYRKFDVVFYLFDHKSLGYMVTQNAACLPGYLIVDKTIDQDDIIYNAITPEALNIISGGYGSYNQVRAVYRKISAIINEGLSNTKTQEVIKGHSTNNSKKKYLMMKLESLHGKAE